MIFKCHILPSLSLQTWMHFYLKYYVLEMLEDKSSVNEASRRIHFYERIYFKNI